MNYPSFESLGITPNYLTFGVSAMRALQSYGWLEDRRAAPNVPAALVERAKVPTRTVHKFASDYVGVYVNRGKFVSRWVIDGKMGNGHVRPHTPEGERWAAQDRARGLGVEYLERRDGTREAYPWSAFEEMDDAA
jgi:hypothetical protein